MTLRVLITGSKGFLGSRLTQKLSQDPAISLLGVDREKGDTITGNLGNAPFMCCNLSDKKQVDRLFKTMRIDAVIHAAAVISNKNDKNYLGQAVKNNLIPQINLISAALEAGCGKFIYCSTISIYDFKNKRRLPYKEDANVSPKTLYGWSKYSSEELLKIMAHTQDFMTGVTLRFSGIHGTGRKNGVIHQMILSSLHGNPIKVDEPESRFRFIFIDDAVEAIRIVLKNKLSSRYSCYNVGGKEIFTLKELAAKITKLTKSRSKIMLAEQKIKRNQVLDISSIIKELKFTPKSFDHNLKNMINHMREHYYETE